MSNKRAHPFPPRGREGERKPAGISGGVGGGAGYIQNHPKITYFALLNGEFVIRKKITNVAVTEQTQFLFSARSIGLKQ